MDIDIDIDIHTYTFSRQGFGFGFQGLRCRWRFCRLLAGMGRFSVPWHPFQAMPCTSPNPQPTTP